MSPAPDQTDDFPNRQEWAAGEWDRAPADDFERHARGGRAELEGDEARDLLAGLDARYAAKYPDALPAGTKASSTATQTAGATAQPTASTSAPESPKMSVPARVRPLRRYLALAATVLLLIVAGWWILRDSGEVDHAAIYATAFEAYPNDISRRTMGQPAAVELPERLRTALAAYDRGDYALARDNFAALDATDDLPQTGLYYGISLLATDDPVAATREFTALENDINYGPAARWYLALTALHRGNVALATERLRTISNDSSSLFQGRAERLLAALTD